MAELQARDGAGPVEKLQQAVRQRSSGSRAARGHFITMTAGGGRQAITRRGGKNQSRPASNSKRRFIRSRWNSDQRSGDRPTTISTESITDASTSGNSRTPLPPITRASPN